jgi:CRISPR-associated protein Cas2
MPMTVVVTRDVPDRFRGFLVSAMLEIAPGVYTAPTLSTAVRERIWKVMTDWYSEIGRGSIVMTWRDSKAPGRQAVLTLGTAPVRLIEYDGMMLAKRD